LGIGGFDGVHGGATKELSLNTIILRGLGVLATVYAKNILFVSTWHVASYAYMSLVLRPARFAVCGDRRTFR
jgi:hypothetical protein